MATNPSLEIQLTPLGREGRPVEEWLTTFHLASVVIDPYTNESSWVLPSAARILRGFTGAAVRVNFLITCDEDDARSFLGPLADEFLVFCDPERAMVRSLGLERLPAFVFLRADGVVAAAAEGWDPRTWRDVAASIADVTAWSVPTIPAPGDPAAFEGTPALT